MAEDTHTRDRGGEIARQMNIAMHNINGWASFIPTMRIAVFERVGDNNVTIFQRGHELQEEQVENTGNNNATPPQEDDAMDTDGVDNAASGHENLEENVHNATPDGGGGDRPIPTREELVQFISTGITSPLVMDSQVPG